LEALGNRLILTEQSRALEPSRRATLSIDRTRHVGDGNECRPHPCGRLDGAGGEGFLVARRQPARGDASDIGRPHAAEMPQRLNDHADGAARSDEVFGRGVPQVDDPLAEQDTAGRTICQGGALGRNHELSRCRKRRRVPIRQELFGRRPGGAGYPQLVDINYIAEFIELFLEVCRVFAYT
jgi:hypothetical protein